MQYKTDEIWKNKWKPFFNAGYKIDDNDDDDNKMHQLKYLAIHKLVSN